MKSKMESKADLHFHTWHSIDSLISPKTAVDMAVAKGIRVLAITDHDTIEGAKVAKKYAEKNNLPVEIIIGEEIYSNGGHVIGLFLEERIESFQPLDDTLEQLKAQNAIVVIPHIEFEEDPLGEYLYRYRVSYTDFLKRPELLDLIHGIETENFQLIEPDFHDKAEFINNEFLKKAHIGSSDCHIKMNFGYSFTLFEGSTVADLKKAILAGTTRAKRTKKSPLLGQALGFFPLLKLPVHLTLQFTYRLLLDTGRSMRRFFS